MTRSFTTPLGSGAAANAAVGPVGTVLVNGVDSGVGVTISGAGATGRYTAAFTLPSLFFDDVVELEISATTNAIAERKVVWDDAVDLSLDDSGRVNVGKVNDSATAAAVFGALGELGFVGNSAQPPTGKDFAFNAIDGLLTPSAGWLIFYFGEPRRIETYDNVILSGTTDRPFTTAMEGGNPVIVMPAYSTRVPATAGTTLSTSEEAALSRIDSNAALISAGGFYVTSRVSNSNLIIWQGETWNHAEGTHETITKGAGETWPTDLTGYTITSTITKTGANNNTGSLSTLAMTCTVTQATGPSQSFYIETGTTTANLAIGEGTRGYDWHVKAVKGTNEATLRAGTGSVRRRL